MLTGQLHGHPGTECSCIMSLDGLLDHNSQTAASMLSRQWHPNTTSHKTKDGKGSTTLVLDSPRTRVIDNKWMVLDHKKN